MSRARPRSTWDRRITFSHTRSLAGIFALILCAGPLAAAEPVLTHLFPVAGQRGTHVAVTAAGKFDPWPALAWVDSPGIVFKPGKDAGKFDVEIAADAAVGPHLVRVFNGEGSSAPRFFIVSREPELAEVEPNDDFKSPQKITSLPATISGRLDKAGDVDSYAVTLKKGQTLVAWMQACVLGSTADGMLRIVDSRGTQLAFNHDGITIDPFLAWEAPADGTFIVQTMGFLIPPSSEVRFTGSENCVYRLHFTAGPFARQTLPLFVPRGKKTAVELLGWNLGAPGAEIDGTGFSSRPVAFDWTPPGLSTDRALDISNIPEAVEKEPNDTPDAAQTFAIPGAVTGRIGRPGDLDCFAFTAVKARVYHLAISATRVGSPLDASLKIENKEGKELSRMEDPGGSRDPEIAWTAPADGTYIATVGSATRRGSPGHIYRLAITEPAPGVTGTITGHSLSVQIGKSADVKVAFKRVNRSKAKLQLIAKDLPEGVLSEPADVPDKDGEVTLKVSANADAKPASQPVRFILREIEGGAEHPVLHMLTGVLKNDGDARPAGELVIRSTGQIWLSVLPEAKK